MVPGCCRVGHGRKWVAEEAVKVLYILWDGGVGGAACNLADFARRQTPGRYDVTVCLLSESGHAVESILGPNVRAVEMRANSGLDMRACLRMIRFLRSNRFDVIHNNAMTYFLPCSVDVRGERNVSALSRVWGCPYT